MGVANSDENPRSYVCLECWNQGIRFDEFGYRLPNVEPRAYWGEQTVNGYEILPGDGGEQ